MNTIYLKTGKLLTEPGIIFEAGGLRAFVGQTRRTAEERGGDHAYSKFTQATGGLKDLYTWSTHLQDHDIHPLLKKHPDVERLDGECFLFKTDTGDGSAARLVVEQILQKLEGKVTPFKESFQPRNYQPTDIDSLFTILMTHKRGLLSTFPGWGKTTCVPELISRLTSENIGQLFLVTTPAVVTLKDIVQTFNTWNYNNVPFFLLTFDDICTNVKQIVTEKLSLGINVVVLLSVQRLRRSDTGSRIERYDQEYYIETELQEKLAFLKGFPFKAWIRDEYHKQYGGIVTSKVFSKLDADHEYLIDMTATPYNLIEQGYPPNQIVVNTMLNVLKNKQNGIVWAQQFPTIGIETWEGKPLNDDSILGKVYLKEEEWDPRKLCAVKNGQLKHAGAIQELNRRMYGSVHSKEKNILSISEDCNLSKVAKTVGIHILAKGNKQHPAEYRCQLYVELLNNDPTQKMFYVAMYDFNNGTIDEFVSEKLKESHSKNKQGVILVTHRKGLIGSDIPVLGHGVLFDKISSVNEFVQLLGRLFRIYQNKDQVKLYIACPGTNISIIKYQVCLSEARQTNSHPRDYWDCLPLTEYAENKEYKLVSRNITYDQAVKHFNFINNRLHNRFVTLIDISKFAHNLQKLIDGTPDICFTDLGDSSSDPSKRLTEDSNAEVFKPNEPPPNEPPPNEDIKNTNWKQIVKTMLNQAIRLGYTHETTSIKETFQTVAAEYEFGKGNTTLLSKCFENDEFYDAANHNFVERLEEAKELRYTDFNLFHDLVYINEKYKIDKGLVYTPPELVREIINRLPLSNKENPTIIVVNALSGSFPIVVREQFPSARIICVEYFSHNVEYLKRIGYEVIYLQENVNNLNMGYIITRLIGSPMEFDALLTNPPYKESDRDDEANKLWPYFVVNGVKCLKDGGILAMITPPSWCSKGADIGKGENGTHLYADIFSTLQTEYICLDSDRLKKYFKGVGSKFSWFVIRNSPYKNNTVLEIDQQTYIEIDLRKHKFLSKIISKESSSIQSKMIGTPFDFLDQCHEIKSDKINGRKESLKQKEPDATYCYKNYHTPAQAKKGFFHYSKEPHSNYSKPKVMISLSGIYEAVPDNGTMGYTGMCITLLTPHIYTAAGVLNSKLYQFWNFNTKTAGFNPRATILNFPAVDLDRNWSDEELYAHFNLTEDETLLVEKTFNEINKKNKTNR